MLNFNFSEKGLGLVSPPHFVYDFSRKMFLMLHSINWPNLIVWLPLLLEIFDNMCITIVCYPGCDFIKFEINLIKPFCYMTKKSSQTHKYLENEKSFWVEIKSIFYFTQSSVIFPISPNHLYAWLYYPLIWWRTSLSWYYFCLQVVVDLSFHCCFASCYCYILVWLWYFVTLLFSSLVAVTVVLLTCCLHERSDVFIRITYSEPLRVFDSLDTPKLYFTFSWW